MSEIQLAVRAPNVKDIDFITNSWLESFRDGYFVSTVPNRVYYNQHHKIMEKLLPRSVVLVACNEKDPDHLYGWICAEVMDQHLILHYVYVKDSLRRFGIAKKLIQYLMKNLPVAQDRLVTTHQTQKSKTLIKGWKSWDLKPAKERYGIEFLYNPYLLFYSLPEGWEKA
jgi:GNAT superfamily N-acetyltransferase